MRALAPAVWVEAPHLPAPEGSIVDTNRRRQDLRPPEFTVGRIRSVQHGRRDGGGAEVRLHRCRSRIRGLRARKPALGGQPAAGPAAGGGTAGPLVEQDAGQLREAHRRSVRELVLPRRTGRRLRGAVDSNPPRTAAGRVERDQRTRLRAGTAARLRHLGAARQPRLELRRRPADIQAPGAFRERSGRVAFAGRAASGKRGAGPEPALRGAVPGRSGSGPAAQPGLQRIEPGRDLQDADHDQPGQADEHRALLSPARPGTGESRSAVRGAGEPGRPRRKALRRGPLPAQRPRGRGAGGA